MKIGPAGVCCLVAATTVYFYFVCVVLFSCPHSVYNPNLVVLCGWSVLCDAGGQSLAVVAVVPPAGVNVIPPVSDLPPRTADVASRLSTIEAGHLSVIQALNDTVRGRDVGMR